MDMHLLMLYVTKQQEETIKSLFEENNWTLVHSDKSSLCQDRRHVIHYSSLDDFHPTVHTEHGNVASVSPFKTPGLNNIGASDVKPQKFVLNFTNTSPNPVAKICHVNLDKLPADICKNSSISVPLIRNTKRKSGGNLFDLSKVSGKQTKNSVEKLKDKKVADGKLTAKSSVKQQKANKIRPTLKRKGIAVTKGKAVKQGKPEGQRTGPMEGGNADMENGDENSEEISEDGDDNDRDYIEDTGSNDESDGDTDYESNNSDIDEAADECGDELNENVKKEADGDYLPYLYDYSAKKKCMKNIKRKLRLEAKEEKAKKGKKVKVRKIDENAGTGIYPCATCKKVYKFKRRYLVHLKDGVCKNQCKYCGKICKKRNIKSHIFNIHEKNDVKFKCQVCGKRFYQKYMLSDHMLIHGNEKKYVCDFCGMAFYRKLNLHAHKKVHDKIKSDTRYPCPVCNKIFTSKYYLTFHLKVTHATSKNFMCDLCGNKYKTKYSLEGHKRAVHRGERNYPCNICGKVYKYSHQVSTHKKLFHEKLVRFFCSVCKKGFYFENKLKDHMNIHTNLKPYSCEHCVYTCNTKEQMTQHRRKHRRHGAPAKPGAYAGPAISSVPANSADMPCIVVKYEQD